MSHTRRLAAILAADIAGYSRLMGADEEGTHERLQAHLRELVNPKINKHRGRIVKNTGDGLLAEFPSVVDAVRCSVEIQRGMVDREPEVPEERRIRFRIGINLGDVIAEEHDIFGDRVNVAARLEGLAEPEIPSARRGNPLIRPEYLPCGPTGCAPKGYSSPNPARAAPSWDRAYRPCERTLRRALFSCRCQNTSRIRPACANQSPTSLRPRCRGSGCSARRDRRL